ncbi:hypothetical protein BKA70DRAFT_125453 [Coprinopsis sp. MPI-PUGE-AT-0042]|nr:hypothetical protein BKA70DRAFT_125453 [Coprinopsis sp. MPI-PUGE-AT-0042]
MTKNPFLCLPAALGIKAFESLSEPAPSLSPKPLPIMSTPTTAPMPAHRPNQAQPSNTNPSRDSFTLQLLRDAQRIEVTEEWKRQVNTAFETLLDYTQRIDRKIDVVSAQPRVQSGNIVSRFFWTVVDFIIAAIRVAAATVALYFVGWHLYDGRLLRIMGVRVARILVWLSDRMLQA